MPVWSNDDWLTCLKEKRVDYEYGFSDIFHSGDCIKMATGKWHSIYFRQDDWHSSTIEMGIP